MSRGLAEGDLAKAVAFAEVMRYMFQPQGPLGVQQASFATRKYGPTVNRRLGMHEPVDATALLLTRDHLVGVDMALTWKRTFGRPRWEPQQVSLLRRAATVFVADAGGVWDRSATPSFTVGFRDLDRAESIRSLPTGPYQEQYAVAEGWLQQAQALVAALPQI